jgi:hypothetical protein
VSWKRPLKLLLSPMRLVGVDPHRARQMYLAASSVPRFIRDMRMYARQAEEKRFPLEMRHLNPMLTDFEESAGTASGHYFHQDLWAARKIYARRPTEHVDVGSRLDGFVAHLLVFMPVTVFDIRSLTSDTPDLTFVKADATRMSGIADSSIDSISSLHAIEHFGLGRYGDPVDPEACFAAMRALARVLRPDGRLYFSVPIGRERVEFNAHRVFAPRTVLDTMHDLDLVSFSAVDDHGRIHADVEPSRFADASFSCGLFEFTKRAGPRAPAAHR